jgi:Fur family ferric uptake transcriptional regulator
MKVIKEKRSRRVADEPEGVFRACLAQNGLRLTVQRRDVLTAVLASQGHFAAEELHAALRASGKSVSLATVYRTLGLLCDCGLLRRAPRWEDRQRYESVYGQQHHDHMLCVECGRVIEFCDDELEDLQRRICRRHGFAPMERRMGIRGLCRTCRARAKGKDR